MKRFLWISISFSFCLFLCLLAFQRTGGFRTSAILFTIENDQDWQTKKPSGLVRKVLSQKFSYLGKGRQTFVFASADGKYVLKFFNYHHLYYPAKVNVPLLKNKKHRIEGLFSSYKLAFETLKKETGLLYLHLNQGSDFVKTIQLVNPCGVLIEVDLNKTYFVLQRKADLLPDCFATLADQGKLKEGVDAFLELVLKKIDKQVIDDDLDAVKNYGFIGSRVVNFDAGRYQKKEISHQLFDAELKKSTKVLFKWMIKRYPEEAYYLRNKVKSLAKTDLSF